MSSDGSLTATATLLRQVFPDARVGDVAYLRWLYEQSPFGHVVETNVDDDHGRAAHYAVVPVALCVDGHETRGALSLNTAVHERARGGGTFVRLAAATFEEAARAGIEVVVGVANANSTPGFVRRLGFENHGPLAATVLLPTPGPRAGIRSAPAHAAAGAALLQDADGLVEAGPAGWARKWTAESLAWRLACPATRYVVHRSDQALMITTAERRAGVNVAVLLAVFAAAALAPGHTRQLIRAACRTHRAPLAIHVGVNDRVPFQGLPLPERLRPSPLNLISRTLGDVRVPPASRFEFLDFDAY